jgi:arginyl-tRNA synthetase
LYATKDLALAELKFKEYPESDRSLMLVDSRQSFYFKQLFEALRRMGFTKPMEFVGYEFVTLKEGAMSSRKGNVITYQSFRDEVMKYAISEIMKRHEGDDKWHEGKVQHTAWALAMAGVKFGMLKQDSDKIYTFDLERALSFDGATGPYCQYAATRLGSILKKAGGPVQADEGLTRGYDHVTEKQLAMTLATFPAKVQEAAVSLRPSVIAQWCLDAAQSINAFYRDVPVLESQGALREGRLRLAQVARQTLVRGLDLLGIPAPDEM